MAICVAVLFCVREVPGGVIALFGGPSNPVDRYGGLRLEYEPPPEAQLDAFDRELLRASKLSPTGVTTLELPKVAIDDVSVASVVEVLVAGGLQMREALEDDWAVRIAADNPLVITGAADQSDEPDPADPRARLETDVWRAEDGSTHRTFFLMARDRRAIEAAIGAARARGVQLAPGSEIVFETVEQRSEHPGTWVRAYALSTVVPIDGRMIERAEGSFDPNTERPIVLLDFTAEGAALFCDLTREISGRKLAIVLGGTVRSAPMINGPICAGRASIDMGGADPDRQLRDRDLIVEVLGHGALPRGGRIRALLRVSPANTTIPELLGRLLLGLLAGLAAAIATFAAVRFARPVRATRSIDVAGVAWRRVAVTALAPLALIVGKRLLLPGLDDAELEHVVRGGDLEFASVIALGLSPILLAYVIVELVALAVPAWRWRRHDPAGRIGLGRATALVAIALAVVHGWFVARYLEGLPSQVVDAAGWKFQLIAMLSLAAGTLLLAIVAGLVTEHGLGNGYGVILASAIVLDLIPRLDALSARYALELVVFLAIAVAGAAVLRWRIGEGKQPTLRLPTSGVAPLGNAAALVGAVFSLTGLIAHPTLFDMLQWTVELSRWPLQLVFVAISVPIWAWLFARPAVIERVSLQGGGELPTRATWLRALAVSALLVIGTAVLTGAASTVSAVVSPVSALVVAAVALDVIGDARARRARLAIAAVVHQPQYLGVIERALGEATIPFHVHAGHLRTLLAWFAPWAPTSILVPEAHAIEARLVVEAALQPARGRVPEARALRAEAPIRGSNP